MLKRFFSKLIEGMLMLSSTVTTLTVLLIILYLFRESIGLFKMNPIEHNFSLLVNKNNSVKELNAQQIKLIFDQEITNWNEVGGADEMIELFRIDDIGSFYTEEEIGANFEHLNEKIDDHIAKTPNVIAFIPDKYELKNASSTPLIVDKLELFQLLKNREWFPTAQPAAQLGILPLLMGTIIVSIGAILLALPFGLAAAIYLAEIAHVRFRNIAKPLIELLAGIPSVVYGFFGLVVIVPMVQQAYNLPVGETALSGSIVLGIMALPTIITVSEDAIRNTPRSMKEASLALGANKWQTILRVVIPYSISGITTAAILGIGRAIGETMAVLMVTGNAAVIPHTILQPVRTIPATIAAELGEAPFGGMHFKALFLLGSILFIITMIINFVVEFISPKKRKER
jgi:phosphate transport system permease protein